MSPNQDWRVTLQEWLKENPKTMPDELNELHQSFLEEFPIEKVSNFAYEDFVSEYGYWYWLTERTSLLAKRVSLLEEYKESNNFTNQWVGIIKNVLQNIKLWIRTHSSTVSEKIDRISKKVEEEFGKKNNRLIIRLLYLHFPSDFLPIVNQKHIIHILNYFKQSYQGNICEDNHRLTQFLLQQPEFNCIDTHQITEFLYSSIVPLSDKSIITEPEYRSKFFQDFFNNTKNVILYGVLGTGKTYSVNHFLKSFLYNQMIPINEIVNGLNSEETLMLAMYENNSCKQLFSILDLINNWIVKAKCKLRAMANPSTLVQIGLGLPYSKEINEGYWGLTDFGKQYVEEKMYHKFLEITNHVNITPHKSKYLRFVTFHQSFAYEEFVEGIKPVIKPITDDSGEVNYKVDHGVFKQICRDAENDLDNKYLIIIDEINRANIAKVFGELITLIEDDKRGSSGFEGINV